MVEFLFSISLFGTITNFYSFSLSFVPLLFLMPLFRMKVYRQNIDLLYSILVLYAYFLVHTIFYSPRVLFEYGFYRRDGNVFATFMPIILLLLINAKFDTEKLVYKFIMFASVVDVICMLMVTTGTSPFLFHAHNAAGGFMAEILSINIGMLLTAKHKTTRVRLMICAVVNLVSLIVTDSRGSSIGFILAALIFYYWYKNYDKKGFPNMKLDWYFFMAVLVVDIALIATIASESLFDSFVGALRLSKRTGTIAERMVYAWPRAIQLFELSPIIGLSFGSYNDIPLRIVNVIPGWFAYNDPPSFYFNDGHAHHSYLHVMAETGMIGLILTLIMIYHIRKAIFSIRSDAMRRGLFFAFYTALYSSFTEHRFFTPSQMLPFTIILGMILNEENRKREKSLILPDHLDI